MPLERKKVQTLLTQSEDTTSGNAGEKYAQMINGNGT